MSHLAKRQNVAAPSDLFSIGVDPLPHPREWRKCLAESNWLAFRICSKSFTSRNGPKFRYSAPFGMVMLPLGKTMT